MSQAPPQLQRHTTAEAQLRRENCALRAKLAKAKKERESTRTAMSQAATSLAHLQAEVQRLRAALKAAGVNYDATSAASASAGMGAGGASSAFGSTGVGAAAGAGADTGGARTAVCTKARHSKRDALAAASRKSKRQRTRTNVAGAPSTPTHPVHAAMLVALETQHSHVGERAAGPEARAFFTALSNHCAGHANSVADIAAAIVQGACSVYFATTESADIGESNGTEGGEPNAALRDPANSSTQMCLEQLAALVHRAAGHGSLARVGLCSAVAARLASLVLDGPADGQGDGSDHGMTAALAFLFVVLCRLRAETHRVKALCVDACALQHETATTTALTVLLAVARAWPTLLLQWRRSGSLVCRAIDIVTARRASSCTNSELLLRELRNVLNEPMLAEGTTSPIPLQQFVACAIEVLSNPAKASKHFEASESLRLIGGVCERQWLKDHVARPVSALLHGSSNEQCGVLQLVGSPSLCAAGLDRDRVTFQLRKLLQCKLPEQVPVSLQAAAALALLRVMKHSGSEQDGRGEVCEWLSTLTPADVQELPTALVRLLIFN